MVNTYRTADEADAATITAASFRRAMPAGRSGQHIDGGVLTCLA